MEIQDYWKCNCKNYFIHLKKREKFCSDCNTFLSDTTQSEPTEAEITIDNISDLFNSPELIPGDVIEVLNKDWEQEYISLTKLNEELNTIGFEIDFYLDAIPYGLRKVKDFYHDIHSLS